MELDNLKTVWQESNLQIESNLVLDSQKLKERTVNKSRSEMGKPLIHEILNIIVISITVIATCIGSIIYSNEPKFSVPGFIAVIIGCLYIYLTIKKAKSLSNIDYINLTIIEIQKEISNFSILILKFRKLELIMFPFFIISILPITFITIQNRDLYHDLSFFLFEIIFIVGLGFLGIFWVNKNLYDKKIKRVQRFLQELTEEKDISISRSV